MTFSVSDCASRLISGTALSLLKVYELEGRTDHPKRPEGRVDGGLRLTAELGVGLVPLDHLDPTFRRSCFRVAARHSDTKSLECS